MEYKLNKIDMELRMKINEATKEGKVHGKTDLTDSDVDKDAIQETNEEKNSKEKTTFKNLKMYSNNKKKLCIDAIKIETVQVEANRDLEEKEFLNKGVLLDIRK